MDFQLNVLQEINSYFEVLTNTIYYLFLLSITIGKFIYCFLQYILYSIITIATYFHQIQIILFEDFTIFCQDLIRILCNGLLSTQETINKSYNFLTKSSYIIFEKTTSLLTININSGICLVINQLKQWFILIGNSCWLLVTIIPNVCLILLNTIYWTIETLFTNTKLTIFAAYNLCVQLKINTIQFITDVPYQAIFGFILAICFIMNRKYVVLGIIYILKALSKIFFNFLRFVQPVQIYQFILRVWIINTLNRWICSIMNFTTMSTYTMRDENINNPYISSTRQSTPETTLLNNPRNVNDQVVQKLSPKNDAFCVICQDRVKCIVLFPCKHLCLCNECAISWNHYQRLCPLCREYIIDTLKVYT